MPSSAIKDFQIFLDQVLSDRAAMRCKFGEGQTHVSNVRSLSFARGSAELIDTLDLVRDKNSPICSFRREPNGSAHDLAARRGGEWVEEWVEVRRND